MRRKMGLGTEKEMWDVWREYALRLLSGYSAETLKKRLMWLREE